MPRPRILSSYNHKGQPDHCIVNRSETSNGCNLDVTDIKVDEPDCEIIMIDDDNNDVNDPALTSKTTDPPAKIEVRREHKVEFVDTEKLTRRMRPETKEAVTALCQNSSLSLQLVPNSFSKVTQLVTNSQVNVVQLIPKSSTKVVQLVPNSSTRVTQLVPNSSNGAAQLVPESSAILAQLIPNSHAHIAQLVRNTPTRVAQFVPGSSKSVPRLVNKAPTTVTHYVHKVPEKVTKTISNSSRDVPQLIPNFTAMAAQLVRNHPTKVKKSSTTVKNSSLVKLVKNSSTTVTQLVPDTSTKVSQLVTNSSSKVTRLERNSSTTVTQLLPNSSPTVTQLVPNSSPTVTQFVPNSSTTVTQLVPNSSTTVTQLVPNSSTKVTISVPNSLSTVTQMIPNSLTNVTISVPNSLMRVPQMLPNSSTQVMQMAPNASTIVTISVPNSLTKVPQMVPNLSTKVTQMVTNSSTIVTPSVPNSFANVPQMVPNSSTKARQMVPNSSTIVTPSVPKSSTKVKHSVPDLFPIIMPSVSDRTAIVTKLVPELSAKATSQVANGSNISDVVMMLPINSAGSQIFQNTNIPIVETVENLEVTSEVQAVAPQCQNNVTESNSGQNNALLYNSPESNFTLPKNVTQRINETRQDSDMRKKVCHRLLVNNNTQKLKRMTEIHHVPWSEAKSQEEKFFAESQKTLSHVAREPTVDPFGIAKRALSLAKKAASKGPQARVSLVDVRKLMSKSGTLGKKMTTSETSKEKCNVTSFSNEKTRKSNSNAINRRKNARLTAIARIQLRMAKGLPRLNHAAKSTWRARCIICQEKFTDKYEFHRHATLAHPGIRIVFCELCSDSFRTDSELKEHRSSFHKITVINDKDIEPPETTVEPIDNVKNAILPSRAKTKKLKGRKKANRKKSSNDKSTSSEPVPGHSRANDNYRIHLMKKRVAGSNVKGKNWQKILQTSTSLAATRKRRPQTKNRTYKSNYNYVDVDVIRHEAIVSKSKFKSAEIKKLVVLLTRLEGPVLEKYLKKHANSPVTNFESMRTNDRRSLIRKNRITSATSSRTKNIADTKRGEENGRMTTECDTEKLEITPRQLIINEKEGNYTIAHDSTTDSNHHIMDMRSTQQKNLIRTEQSIGENRQKPKKSIYSESDESTDDDRTRIHSDDDGESMTQGVPTVKKSPERDILCTALTEIPFRRDFTSIEMDDDEGVNEIVKERRIIRKLVSRSSASSYATLENNREKNASRSETRMTDDADTESSYSPVRKIPVYTSSDEDLVGELMMRKKSLLSTSEISKSSNSRTSLLSEYANSEKSRNLQLKRFNSSSSDERTSDERVKSEQSRFSPTKCSKSFDNDEKSLNKPMKTEILRTLLSEILTGKKLPTDTKNEEERYMDLNAKRKENERTVVEDTEIKIEETDCKEEQVKTDRADYEDKQAIETIESERANETNDDDNNRAKGFNNDANEQVNETIDNENEKAKESNDNENTETKEKTVDEDDEKKEKTNADEGKQSKENLNGEKKWPNERSDDDDDDKQPKKNTEGEDKRQKKTNDDEDKQSKESTGDEDEEQKDGANDENKEQNERTDDEEKEQKERTDDEDKQEKEKINDERTALEERSNDERKELEERSNDERKELEERSIDQRKELEERSNSEKKELEERSNDESKELEKRSNDERKELEKRSNDERKELEKRSNDERMELEERSNDESKELEKRSNDERKELEKRSNDERKELEKRSNDERMELEERSIDERMELEGRSNDESEELEKRSNDERKELEKRSNDERKELEKRSNDERMELEERSIDERMELEEGSNDERKELEEKLNDERKELEERSNDERKKLDERSNDERKELEERSNDERKELEERSNDEDNERTKDRANDKDNEQSKDKNNDEEEQSKEEYNLSVETTSRGLFESSRRKTYSSSGKRSKVVKQPKQQWQDVKFGATKINEMCLTCKELFTLMNKLGSQLAERKIDETAIKCPFCHRYFISIFHIELHVATNHLRCQNEISCKQSQLSNVENSRQGAALDCEIDLAIECPSCTMKFSMEKDLNDHVIAEHKIPYSVKDSTSILAPEYLKDLSNSCFKTIVRANVDVTSRETKEYSEMPAKVEQILTSFTAKIGENPSVCLSTLNCYLCDTKFVKSTDYVRHVRETHHMCQQSLFIDRKKKSTKSSNVRDKISLFYDEASLPDHSSTINDEILAVTKVNETDQMTADREYLLKQLLSDEEDIEVSKSSNCPREFANEESTRKTIHGCVDNKIVGCLQSLHTCSVCEKTFKRAQDLLAHSLRHVENELEEPRDQIVEKVREKKRVCRQELFVDFVSEDAVNFDDIADTSVDKTTTTTEDTFVDRGNNANDIVVVHGKDETKQKVVIGLKRRATSPFNETSNETRIEKKNSECRKRKVKKFKRSPVERVDSSDTSDNDKNDTLMELLETEKGLAKETCTNDKLPIVCSKCNRHFAHRTLLNEHLFFLHDDSLKETVLTDVLAPMSGLRGTDETLQERWRCDTCIQNFKLFQGYSRHRYFVHGDDTTVHICDNCSKVLTTVTMVNVHICTDVASYNCRACNETFATGMSLRLHNSEKHMETNGPHLCPPCNKNFLTSAMLVRHQRGNHRFLRPYCTRKSSPVIMATSEMSDEVSESDNFHDDNDDHDSGCDQHCDTEIDSATKVKPVVTPRRGGWRACKGKKIVKDARPVDRKKRPRDYYPPGKRRRGRPRKYPLTDEESPYESSQDEDEKEVVMKGDPVVWRDTILYIDENDIHQCSVCQLYCLSRSALRNHMAKIHSIMDEVCQLCQKPYPAGKLIRHMMDRHISYDDFNEGRHDTSWHIGTNSNEIDTEIFVRMLGVNRLMSLCEYRRYTDTVDKISYGCPYCETTLPSNELYRYHFLLHHDAMCALCNIEYKKSHDAARHKAEIHGSYGRYIWFADRTVVALTSTKNFTDVSETCFIETLAKNDDGDDRTDENDDPFDEASADMQHLDYTEVLVYDKQEENVGMCRKEVNMRMEEGTDLLDKIVDTCTNEKELALSEEIVETCGNDGELTSSEEIVETIRNEDERTVVEDTAITEEIVETIINEEEKNLVEDTALPDEIVKTITNEGETTLVEDSNMTEKIVPTISNEEKTTSEENSTAFDEEDTTVNDDSIVSNDISKPDDVNTLIVVTDDDLEIFNITTRYPNIWGLAAKISSTFDDITPKQVKEILECYFERQEDFET